MVGDLVVAAVVVVVEEVEAGSKLLDRTLPAEVNGYLIKTVT